MRPSSAVLTYLSRATRSWMRPMISSVVSTPTSDEMSTSSRLSSTSSSTFDFPAMARVSLLNTLALVFSRPASSTSFFSFFEKKLNIPIVSMFLCKLTNFLRNGRNNCGRMHPRQPAGTARRGGRAGRGACMSEGGRGGHRAARCRPIPSWGMAGPWRGARSRGGGPLFCQSENFFYLKSMIQRGTGKKKAVLLHSKNCIERKWKTRALLQRKTRKV